MAKGRSTRDVRDAFSDVAIDPLLDAGLMPGPFKIPRPEPFNPYDFTPLTDVTDGRRFTPTPQDSPRRIDGTKARLSPVPAQMGAVRFDDSASVAACVRRKTRREVIFAKRKHRKGAGSRRRYNFWSKVRC